ncbi:LOW QUALITY PROTEIN: Hypothetical protein PHPALM_3758 [Phytophthora palmivora]|uniref:Uncharacterized protein n=1 Tax=Phytophthora palmivora TaxID=4796 RepID=A0A2P4YLJ9_9STRA|nr:LOW QUALITY PROTEIN: Hypothetical protein PHPALM_3758 [Phytophthora palmivora]
MLQQIGTIEFKDYEDFRCTLIDDLFIFTQSENVDEHFVALREVSHAARISGIGVDGVRIDQSKAATIRDRSTYSTKQEFQSFIGTCVYVSRFCVGFAEHVTVLTELIKNKEPSDQITILAEHQAAFESLKIKLSTASTLAHADSTKSFHFSVDAFDFAVGGYLFQYDESGREIIAYGGRKLSHVELIYPTREKELRGSNGSLVGRTLLQTAYRDAQISQTARAARSTCRNFSVNSPRQLLILVKKSSPPVDILAICRANYHNDTIFGPIMMDVRQDIDSPSGQLRRFSIDDGLFCSRRLCIPAVEALQHDSPARGHPGQAKPLLLLLDKYYWRGMAESVQRYVSMCELCQRHKYVRGKPASLLKIPSNLWTDISMDFMTQLSTTTSSRDAHFIATHKDASAADTATLFHSFYQRLHGLPESIVSDPDTKFMSKLWQAIMHLQETRLRSSYAFRPSIDGQSQVTIKFENEYIRHIISTLHND